MEKNTVWAIVLSTIVLVGFFAVQTFLFPGQNAARNTNQTTKTEQVETESSSPLENEANDSSNVILSDIDSESKEEAKEELFTITTDKVKVTFTNKGGDVVGYELIEKDSNGNIKNLDRNTGKGVEMADNISDKNRAFSLSFGGYENGIINDVFNVQRLDDYTIGFYKNYKTINSDGTENKFTLVKKYSFKKDDYIFKLDVTVDGDYISPENSAYTLRTAPQIGPYFNAKQNRYENRQFISYNGQKAKKIILGTGQSKQYSKEWTWAALAGKYFEMIIYPLDSSKMNPEINYSSVVEVNNYANAQIKVQRNSFTGKETTDSYYIYVGPRNEKELRKYNLSENNSWNIEGSHLDDSLNTSGFFSWLEVILKFGLENIYKLVKNWGVSIIILTVILKLILFPITKKSLEGTQKMQKFQPRIQELQNKYKNDPQKLQAETAKLYKEIGYNPMSGCLPLLFQFLILFAMYNLFNNYFEFRGATFIPGWIDDLSAGDHIGKTFSRGLPILGWNTIRILPVIYLISQLLFGKITGNGGTAAAGQSAAQMKMMMYGMPILFFFLFYNAPSGLLLYWTVSNIFQLGQQLVINKMMKNKGDTTKPVKINKNKR